MAESSIKESEGKKKKKKKKKTLKMNDVLLSLKPVADCVCKFVQ
jgi:hypothetical protein